MGLPSKYIFRHVSTILSGKLLVSHEDLNTAEPKGLFPVLSPTSQSPSPADRSPAQALPAEQYCPPPYLLAVPPHLGIGVTQDPISNLLSFLLILIPYGVQSQINEFIPK